MRLTSAPSTMPSDESQCKRILLLASLRAGSGNAATASRIAHQLRTMNKFIVDCVSVDTPHSESDSFAMSVRRYDAILALHAYRTGQLLNPIYRSTDETLPPLVLIFAGTDLHSCEPKWIPTLEEIIPRAKGLVCFSGEWKKFLETSYKNRLPCKISIIPQSVLILPFIFEQLPMAMHTMPQRKILLWIGEIRSVKDPQFALDVFSHLNNDDYHLFIIGYEQDDQLNESLHRSSSHLNVTFLGGQSQNFVHTIMRTSFAYINTSINEGMCLAILEAMTLGLPVLARRNTGNASLIKHGKTGLLFDTPDQAAEQCLQVDRNKKLRQTLIEQAGQYVKKSHSNTAETKAYRNLLLEVME